MGNRPKRGRADAPDPAAEWQDESRWSGFTRDVRWPFVAGKGGPNSPRRSSMPRAGEWLGIAIVVLGVVLALQLFFWAVSLVLP
jgi:hypothetical protein